MLIVDKDRGISPQNRMLLIQIIALLLAAGATWLARNRPSRIQWVVSASLGFLIWLLSLLMLTAIPDAARFVVWQPADLFQTPLELSLDKASWGLAYCISTVLLSMILMAATRPEIASTRVRSFWFVYAAMATLALFASNLLTVVLTFALIDLCSFIFFILFTESVDGVRRAIVRAGVDLGGLLLFVSAAWVNSIDGGGAGLNATSFTTPAAILFLMGVLLRLGVIPVQFTIPSLSPLQRGEGTLLRLFPPAIALSLLAKFLENGASSTIRFWLAIAGVIGIMVGGVRWLLEEDRISARSYLVMGLAGVGILAASSASANGEILFATSALLLLVGALLSLIKIHTPSHRAWPILAAALMVGMPWSLGGLISSQIGFSAVNDGAWIKALIGIIGLSSLSLGAIHIFFADEETWPTGESLIRVMYSTGLGLPILVSIGLGFWFYETFSIYGGLVSLAAIAVGAGLFFALRNLSGINDERWRSIILRLNLQWIYSAFWGILRRSLSLARSFGELFEGEGAILWMFAFIAVLILALR